MTWLKRKRYSTDAQLKDLALLLSFETQQFDMLHYYYELRRYMIINDRNYMTEKLAREIFGLEENR